MLARRAGCGDCGGMGAAVAVGTAIAEAVEDIVVATKAAVFATVVDVAGATTDAVTVFLTSTKEEEIAVSLSATESEEAVGTKVLRREEKGTELAAADGGMPDLTFVSSLLS